MSDIRADLLAPRAVEVPLLITLTIPHGAESALGSELHITMTLQPALSIDGTSTL